MVAADSGVPRIEQGRLHNRVRLQRPRDELGERPADRAGARRPNQGPRGGVEEAGGPGKVVVVAHSMGGLALRCAAAPDCSGVQDVAPLLAGAVTFGTPNLGTFVKGYGLSLGTDFGGATLGALCAAAQNLSESDGGGCGGLRAFLTSGAARAFTPGSAELAALPTMPRGIPLYAVAGQVRLTTSMYGRPPVTIGRIGDGIVAPDSALAQATAAGGVGGSETVDCGYVEANVVEYAAGLKPLQCWHGGETNDDAFLAPALATIGRILRAQGLSLPRPAGKITGRVSFNHPAWGLSTLVTTELPDRAGGWIYVVDGYQNVRWSRRFAGATDSLAPHKPAIDKLGHIFLDYNPGRYNGVVVLKPVPGGFDDMRTLPPDGEYNGRFYNAQAVDPDGDGQFDIDVARNDCNPSCAGGAISTQVFRWNGDDYAPTGPPRDGACDDDAVQKALCKFVAAIQSGDLGALSAQERNVAGRAGELPHRPWVIDRCQLTGDVTVTCQIRFDEDAPGTEATSAAFTVGPVNGTYNDGQITTPPGEDLRYEVNGYLGLGLSPIDGQ